MIERKIIQEYVDRHHRETVALLKELAVIPAPSGNEEQRAAFVLRWLHENGMPEAFQDGAGNVVYPYQCENNRPLTVIMAHMDVVCPDREALPLQETPDRLIAPGVHDNTANLVNMMMTARFLHSHPQTSENGILFVADVGEEGLGNLKGSRRIWNSYNGRVREWICFDLNYNVIYHRAVGSRRYRVTVRTPGGHSYHDFGAENAIAVLAKIVCDIYGTATPQNPKVTYNVGKIEGGMSVNAIAQEASMICEIRSEAEDALETTEQLFLKILQKYCAENTDVQKEILGVRPGNGTIDAGRQKALEQRCLHIISEHYAGRICFEAGSTDANIPLSEGIPSLTMGTAMGGKTHTRQEWVDTESMRTGQMIAIETVLNCQGETQHDDTTL